MTTSKDLLTNLRERCQRYATDQIARACGLDKQTVRKVKNNVATGTLKMQSLYKLDAGLNSMEGIEND